jgi:hypothetical protein
MTKEICGSLMITIHPTHPTMFIAPCSLRHFPTRNACMSVPRASPVSTVLTQHHSITTAFAIALQPPPWGHGASSLDALLQQLCYCQHAAVSPTPKRCVPAWLSAAAESTSTCMFMATHQQGLQPTVGRPSLLVKLSCTNSGHSACRITMTLMP